MRLIRQERLTFREGKSDKVYEVDLCEAGTCEYVVNFRYGRRGSTLREGTKTTFPVARAEAEDVFVKLVTSKKKKGYISDSDTVEESTESPGEVTDGLEDVDVNTTPRGKRILSYLEAAASGDQDPAPQWKLSRILWRAGEIRLRAAEPHLIQIASSGDMVDYSLAWALGRCGSTNSIEALRDLEATTKFAAAQRLCEAAQLSFETDDVLSQHVEEIARRLPPSFSGILDPESEGHIETIRLGLKRLRGAWDPLYDLYLLTEVYSHLQDSIHTILREIPLEARSFKPVRHILKLAEFRDDNATLGLLGYRFERTTETYNSGWGMVWHDGKWVNVSEVMATPDPGLAYSSRTRGYLRRRTMRTLTRLGDLDLGRYTQLASELLLRFTDKEDKKSPRVIAEYHWESRSTITKRYDVWDYPLLNAILYRNSPRYLPGTGLSGWLCRGEYTPGGAGPPEREEAFPHLWDRDPKTVIRLLRESRCSAVHEMSVKIFRANPDFAKQVSVAALIDFLASAYVGTSELAIELARSMYDPDHPERELVARLATCPVEAGRMLALNWIQDQVTVFVSDQSFVESILFCPHKDVHEKIRQWVPATAPSTEWLRELIEALLPRLIALETSDERADLVRELGDSLLELAPGP